MEAIRKNYGLLLDVGTRRPNPGWTSLALGGMVDHDPEFYPWPLDNESCLRISLAYFIETINPYKHGLVRLFNECWRVLKPSGQVAIVTIYPGSSASWQDPMIVRCYNQTTMCYFDFRHPLYQQYKPLPFTIMDRKIDWRVNGTLEVILQKHNDFTIASKDWGGQA
jgi:hypothetical protein